jgi:rhamnosyltransferase
MSQDISRICCVTITYHPDLEILRRQMDSIPRACKRVVIDNASDAALFSRLGEMLRGYGAELVRNAENVGLATAQNQGAEKATDTFPDIEYLLFLDQDTEPHPGAVDALLEGYLEAAAVSGPGAAGPRLVDLETGLHHGFHVIRGMRWIRLYPPPEQRQAIDCANLNSSGTLVPIAVWRESGGVDGSLFIDHVDTDWAFRMRHLGYGLYGIPSATFGHRMGEASRRIWLFGWHVWPLRSPQRHYYLFRNAVRLMQRDYVPSVWKLWATLKLAVTLLVTMCIDRRPLEQLRQMARGLTDGWSRS